MRIAKPNFKIVSVQWNSPATHEERMSLLKTLYGVHDDRDLCNLLIEKVKEQKGNDTKVVGDKA